MLTPQDLQNKVFPKAVFGGYDMTAVDNFLETATEDYSVLYKENAKLKSKIKVLVEKVEEYRSTEDSMRMALLTAQKMGDDLIDEANKKAAAIIADAENVLKTRMAEASRAVAVEEERLNEAKRANGEFVKRSSELIKTHAEFLSKLETLEVKAEPPAQEPDAAPEASREQKPSAEEDAVKQIDEVMSKLLSEDVADTGASADENAPAPDGDDDEPVTPRPKFDFQNLQFGANYSGEK